MAKWGEGDPRWIVEERADATNVNNWHWTEKNATLWSKDKLKELLVGLKVENDEFSAKIKELSKCEGEATANNRKAKLIFFYEWVINGEWEGTRKNSENKTAYKGTFEVPNLSEEHDPSEVDVSIFIKDSKQDKLKEFMRVEGVKKIREQFAKYIALLKEEFSQGLILPTKDSSSNLKELATKTNSPSSVANTQNGTGGECKSKDLNGTHHVKIQTKKLTLTEEFKCRADELYRAFTDINMVRAFTRYPNSVYEAEKGGKFSLFDGSVSGNFIELVPNKKLVLHWRNKRWIDEHYSVATLEFNEKEDYTELCLTQTGVPESFYENTEDGWKNFYFNPVKQTFGFGSRMF